MLSSARISAGARSGKRHRLFAVEAGEGPLVVLLHGGTGSWRHWSRNIEALARRFHVLVPDLPGFGGSPDIVAETPLVYIDRVAEWVAACAHNESRLSVCGFSFGGAVAAAVASRLAHFSGRLALVGPAGFRASDIARTKLRRVPRDKAADAYEAHRHNLRTLMLANDDSVDAEALEIQGSNVALARFDSRQVSLQPSLLGDLASSKWPLLVVWGERDAVAFPDVATRAAEVRSIRPDARIEVVPDAGHWAQFERAPLVNNLLLQFLSEQEAAPALRQTSQPRSGVDRPGQETRGRHA